MKKILPLRFITIILASVKLIAMEENTIENHRITVQQNINQLTQDPGAIILYHRPHPDEEEIPTNIFCYHNNTWYNIYSPFKNAITSYNDPITNTVFFNELLQKKSNFFDLLERSVKLYFLMNNPIKKTVFNIDLYFDDLPLVIGCILRAKHNPLLTPDLPEFGILEQTEKLVFQILLLAPLIEKHNKKIIHFISKLVLSAIDPINNDTYNITLPVSSLNLSHEYPFSKKNKICNFTNDEASQKDNPFLQECLNNGILIFYSLIVAPKQNASVTFCQYLQEQKDDKSKCILQ